MKSGLHDNEFDSEMLYLSIITLSGCSGSMTCEHPEKLVLGRIEIPEVLFRKALYFFAEGLVIADPRKHHSLPWYAPNLRESPPGHDLEGCLIM